MTGGDIKEDPQYGMPTVDLNNLAYADEPFILDNDVAHVFYVKDITSRKQGFLSGLASPIVTVQSRTGTHGGIRPGEPRGPAGASWALVPVRMDPFVPVPGKN